MKNVKKNSENLINLRNFITHFINESKNKLIEKIKERIKQYREKNISELLKINNFLADYKEFNYELAKEEAKNLKYKDSFFFMGIYSEIDRNDKTEDVIFKESISQFHKIMVEIIHQKESGVPFFQIENVEKILKQLKNPKIDEQKEIKFLLTEFAHLKKEDYIKNNLFRDLKNFASKYKILILLKGIITFIETFDNLLETK